MTTGVARHLGIDLDDYDERIRTFIPRYDEMLDAAAGLFAGAGPAPRLVDLGIGTGALAARCLAVRPRAAVFGIDSDSEILDAARSRLEDTASELTLVRGDFEHTPLPRADAIVASLSLHHVATPRRKRRLYARAFESLRAHGVLVSADCMPAADRGIAAGQYAAWRAHMRQHYDERTVAKYFRAWADEDVYMTLPAEIRLLEAVGFSVEVAWRRGSFAVMVGRR